MENNANIAEGLPFFRVNRLPGSDRVVITNVSGNFVVLPESQFQEYLAGKLDPSSEIAQKLQRKGFFMDADYVERMAAEYRYRMGINFAGPSLHIVVMTKGCNHQCLYCHASAQYEEDPDNGLGLALTGGTAEKIVDTIFSTPAPAFTIEFQGGEPLLNWKTLRHLIEYAEKKRETTGKNVRYALVSNLSLLTEELLEEMAAFPTLSLATSLDGPKEVHNFNRLLVTKSGNLPSFQTLEEKIRMIRAFEMREKRSLLHGAMGVITKKTLSHPREVVDAYMELGFDKVFLKKMNSIGTAERTGNILGYTYEELEKFYAEYLGYLVELSEKGRFVKDGFLEIILQKIFHPDRMNFVDLRSPCGAGVGQVAYDYTGKIYTCDEGRMIEDDVFLIGHAGDPMEKVVQNESVGAMMDASTVESLPCDVCAYAPYCGVCPIESYQGSGNLYTNQVFDSHCQFFMFLFDYVFRAFAQKESREYAYVRQYAGSE
jgi:His-Xaa-Ser system radical SAM maturase HxsB